MTAWRERFESRAVGERVVEGSPPYSAARPPIQPVSGDFAAMRPLRDGVSLHPEARARYVTPREGTVQ